MSSVTAPSWEVGLARGDITAWEPGMATMGWGSFTHRVQGVAERLHVRVLVVRQPSTRTSVALAVLDLCVIPLLLRQAIVDRLQAAGQGFGPHNVMLLATHTHSGPAGLSDSPLYNSVNFGFAPDVFDHIVEASVDAILRADHRRQPGRIRPGRVRIPTSEPIAFNRSVLAHRANSDVARELTADEAVDRWMSVLRVEDALGQEIGAVSFFASHGTAVHSDRPLLHPDHKGLAASMLEQRRGHAAHGGLDYVALFAQTASGDATPNFRPCPARGFDIATCDDDYASAAKLGDIEATYASRALDLACDAPALEGILAGHTRHVAPGDTAVAPEYALGLSGVRTRAARMGLPFMVGTREGAGPLGPARGPIMAWMLARRRRVLRRARGERQEALVHADPQVPLLDLARGIDGRFFGLIPCSRAGYAAAVDPGSAWFHAAHRAGVLANRPWVPEIVPAQLLRLGPLVIAGLPAEPTTQAGRRLQRAVLGALEGDGVSQVIVAGYANGYTSYVTTREEYLCQRYEGGSTLFGPWTLGAWCTVLQAMARQPWPTTDAVDGPSPVLASRELLLRERESARGHLGRFRVYVAGQQLGHLRH